MQWIPAVCALVLSSCAQTQIPVPVATVQASDAAIEVLGPLVALALDEHERLLVDTYGIDSERVRKMRETRQQIRAGWVLVQGLYAIVRAHVVAQGPPPPPPHDHSIDCTGCRNIGPDPQGNGVVPLQNTACVTASWLPSSEGNGHCVVTGDPPNDCRQVFQCHWEGQITLTRDPQQCLAQYDCIQVVRYDAAAPAGQNVTRTNSPWGSTLIVQIEETLDCGMTNRLWFEPFRCAQGAPLDEDAPFAFGFIEFRCTACEVNAPAPEIPIEVLQSMMPAGVDGGCTFYGPAFASLGSDYRPGQKQSHPDGLSVVGNEWCYTMEQIQQVYGTPTGTDPDASFLLLRFSEYNGSPIGSLACNPLAQVMLMQDQTHALDVGETLCIELPAPCTGLIWFSWQPIEFHPAECIVIGNGWEAQWGM